MMRKLVRCCLGAGWVVLVGVVFGGLAYAEEPIAVPKFAPGMPTPKDFDALKKQLETQYEKTPAPEGERMFLAIMNGSSMGPGEGWFGPAQSRYTYARLAERHKVDAKSMAGISAKQFMGDAEFFRQLDRNRDGKILPDDLDWGDRNPYLQSAIAINRAFRRIDTKGDGKVTREEWLAFFEKNSEHGTLSMEQLSGAALAGYSTSFTPGDAPNRDVLLKGLFAGEIGSLGEGPAVGSKAPNFRRPTVDGSRTIELKELLGKKPVVLITGNFTCGPFRAYYPGVEELYAMYGDRANFVMVYVREAHPTDGWKMESNAKAGVVVKQPTAFGERVAVAKQFCTKLNPTLPVVVDDVNDEVGNAYSGMPARLYLIDATGTVVYKSGRGPFGFKTPELEHALVMHLAEQDVKPQTTFALPTDAQTWAVLPRATKGANQPLPNWAKAIATQLPRTAAAMLELDFAQRTKSPLDPILRAKMRWVIAHANRCAYTEATAMADLKRAGADANTIAILTGPKADWPTKDQGPLAFAENLTRSASTINDADFAALKTSFGETGVAAMVLLSAYGNFQDRFLLGLELPLEVGGALPPLEVVFDTTALQAQSVLPKANPPAPLRTAGKHEVGTDPEWGELSYETLQTRLKQQRERQPRLPIPTWEQAKSKLPARFTTKPTRIIWNLVCYYYAPELAAAWTQTTRTMWIEAPQDRVLEESLFWVQTRGIRCNYCMGHCEMLLEVAGLTPEQIATRTRALSSENWSVFPPIEQRAYAYARTLTKTPWDLKLADYRTLETDHGPKNAMALYFWLCRGLYMTRISDGFALPLEKDNVFADYAKK